VLHARHRETPKQQTSDDQYASEEARLNGPRRRNGQEPVQDEGGNQVAKENERRRKTNLSVVGMPGHLRSRTPTPA